MSAHRATRRTARTLLREHLALAGHGVVSVFLVVESLEVRLDVDLHRWQARHALDEA